jgi:hypothetical protein
MVKRRRFKQTQTLETRLAEQAAYLREQARCARSVIDRERLIALAQRAETAIHISEWLSSPGLQSPK